MLFLNGVFRVLQLCLLFLFCSSLGWFFDFYFLSLFLDSLWRYLRFKSFLRVLMYTSFFASFAWAGLLFLYLISILLASGLLFFGLGRGFSFFSFFFLQDFTFRNRFFFLCFFFLFFEDFSQWDFYIGAGGRCTKCKVLQYLGWGDHGRGGVLLSENLGIGGGACDWRGMHAGDRRGGILRQVKFGSGGGKRVCSFLPRCLSSRTIRSSVKS